LYLTAVCWFLLIQHDNGLQNFAHTVCPTRYRTRRFFNKSNTNEDIAMKIEQECVRCVRNEKECVWSVCKSASNFVAISSLVVKLLKKCRVR